MTSRFRNNFTLDHLQMIRRYDHRVALSQIHYRTGTSCLKPCSYILLEKMCCLMLTTLNFKLFKKREHRSTALKPFMTLGLNLINELLSTMKNRSYKASLNLLPRTQQALSRTPRYIAQGHSAKKRKREATKRKRVTVTEMGRCRS